jgi:Asp-tRNA(Asn)/Glu-tRNA(Gln) amidotransferase A subunit family amidase
MEVMNQTFRRKILNNFTPSTIYPNRVPHAFWIKAALVRYSIAGNFLGLPAITVMVGYDKAGLPIGLQFIGRPWSEATLLHIAFAMQASEN